MSLCVRYRVIRAVGIVVVLITPGPTNTLLASAGLRQGVRRSLAAHSRRTRRLSRRRFPFGDVFSHRARARLALWLPALLRVAAGTYIAWLAVDMVARGRRVAGLDAKASGTLRLFIATLLNPKALLFAGTIFPAAAFVLWPAYLLSMLIFACLLAPIALAWIAFGAALGRGKLGWLNPAKIQRGASVVLGVFSLTLAWSALD